MNQETPKKSVSKQVFESIENMMQNGELLPGQFLPPERELATQFQVGRPAVREALKALEIIGAVEITQGRGAMVISPSVENLFYPFINSLLYSQSDILNFTEARAVIEPQCSLIAATRATASQLQKLYEQLVDMRNSLDDPDRFADADFAFHNLIAQATNNPILVKIYESMAKFLWQLLQQTKNLPDLKTGLKFHEGLYKAIYARNSAEASRQMQLHIDDTRKRFMEFQKQESKTEVR